MSRHILILILILSCNLWPCVGMAKSWVLPVEASIGESGKVQFCINSRFGETDGSGKITQINLYNIGEKPLFDNIGQDWVLVWSLSGRSDQVQFTKCFFYAEIFGGLTETVPSTKLLNEKVYRLNVSTRGEGGTLHFKLSDCGKSRRLEIIVPEYQFE